MPELDLITKQILLQKVYKQVTAKKEIQAGKLYNTFLHRQYSSEDQCTVKMIPPLNK